jgi:hypothetical protein
VKAILQVAAECTMAGQHTMALAQYHRARAVWRKAAAAGLTPSGELSPGETLFFAVAVGSVLEMAGMESDALLMYRRCETHNNKFRPADLDASDVNFHHRKLGAESEAPQLGCHG